MEAPTDTPSGVMWSGDCDFAGLCCGGVALVLVVVVEEGEGEGEMLLMEEGEGEGEERSLEGMRREESLLTARCLRTRGAGLLSLLLLLF